MHPKHDTLLNEHYRHAMLKVSELQHAETAQQSVDLLDDLVHHLTRLSDGLNKRIALDERIGVDDPSGPTGPEAG